MYRKRFLYKRKKVAAKADNPAEPLYRVKPIKGEDNGKTRDVLLKKSVCSLIPWLVGVITAPQT